MPVCKCIINLSNVLIMSIICFIIMNASADAMNTTINISDSETYDISGVYQDYINVLDETGAGVANVAGTLNVNADTIIKNNKGAFGGAIAVNQQGQLIVKENVVFENNTATFDGGAIANDNSAVIGINATFKNNQSNIGLDGNETESYNGPVGGGAISLGLTAKLTTMNSLFEGNVSGYNGGAIATERILQPDQVVSFDSLNSLLDIKNSTFINNKADDITVDEGNGTYSGGNGGAIANTFAKSSVMDSVFNANSAASNGGAVYNNTFIETGTGNITELGGNLEIENVKFESNSAASAGGAIYNAGTLTVTGNRGNTLFGANVSDSGGAIYNSNVGTVTEISHSLFQKNQSNNGGAIYNVGNITSILNSSFISNAAGTNKGGAILNQGVIDNVNTVAFINNISGQGGAINNAAGAVINKINAIFNANQSLVGDVAQGGAIYNAGTINLISDSSFTGNQAGNFGGAIFNETGANINFSGNNYFTANTANDQGNDIYNSGNITIQDGTTTIGSGIDGKGTLTVKEGAKLSIGLNDLYQDTLNLDGILYASIINPTNFARINVKTINVGKDGKLNLTLSAVGKYDLGTQIEINNIIYNSLIYDVDVEGSNLIVATKTIEEISAETNLSYGAAATLIGLANSANYSMNIALLNAQSALVGNNIEYVENESKKLLGKNAPINQAISVNLQNQIMSVAKTRMNIAQHSTGRSGGESFDLGYGIWLQGLVNRVKYEDDFTGNTNGVSIGFDTLINDKFTVGIGYLYDRSTIDSDINEADISSNTIFLYTQYKPSKWYINAVLNYTMSGYEETATAFGMIINPNYDVYSFGGQVMTGYDFSIGFRPELGLRYLNIYQNSYNNTFADFESHDTNYITGIAGLNYDFIIETAGRLQIIPEVQAAVVYDVLSDAEMTTVILPSFDNYVVSGNRLNKFGGSFAIGLSLKYNDWKFSVNYDIEFRKNYTSQTGMVKFIYEF